MIRIIVKSVGYAPLNDAIAEVQYEMFLVDAPELEKALKASPSYGSKFIIGGAIEAPPIVIEPSQPKEGGMRRPYKELREKMSPGARIEARNRANLILENEVLRTALEIIHDSLKPGLNAAGLYYLTPSSTKVVENALKRSDDLRARDAGKEEG